MDAQEGILSFSTTQIHQVVNEKAQNSLIYNSYGFGQKVLIDYDIFNEMFFSRFEWSHVAGDNF